MPKDLRSHLVISDTGEDNKVKMWGGDVVQLVEHRTGMLPTQVRFSGAARDFSPSVSFQCRLSYDVRTPPCVQSHAFTTVPMLKIP